MLEGFRGVGTAAKHVVQADVMTDHEFNINNSNLTYVEDLYVQYLQSPEKTPPEWRRYFEQMDREANGFASHPQTGPSFHRRSVFEPLADRCINCQAWLQEVEMAPLQARVDLLIRNYRVRGHIIAQVDPLGQPRPEVPELNPAFYGFTDEDLNRPFSTEMLRLTGQKVLLLRQIIEILENTYCRSIGVQFMHMDDLRAREWLQGRMESSQNQIELDRQTQLRILTRLTDAVIFEEFIQKKYVGAKSFSLEGAESLIPLLDLAIEKASARGMEEVVLAMAHRGRLNVLANIMGKSPRRIFQEFDDRFPDLHPGAGDVKYHLGAHYDWITVDGNTVHLSLCFNPSHLEFVNPVALGRVRAKQDRLADREGQKSMAFLIHGDAAFAGEGIIQETLNLSELKGYQTGGALHVVVNNQLGFTTSPEEGRSTVYATDVARMLQIPIFHVNGENPEAVAQVVSLAMEFRHVFKRDVVVDMYCYRRRGHNEGDEPTFTQPILYKVIRSRKTVRDGYLDHLLKLQGVTLEEADEIARRRTEALEEALALARNDEEVLRPSARATGLGRIWSHYHGGPFTAEDDVETAVPAERASTLLESLAKLPASFHPHPKMQRPLEARLEMARGDRPLDWAAAEALAFASLATQGIRVRVSGQDSQRGTFSHRHAVLHDVQNGTRYTPLQHLAPDQAPVEIFNSPLSEAGVLGFEYGFAMGYPDSLCIWEAQFGDFVNAAQVIIDQFLVSGEDKWGVFNGLTMFLPHGFEGQGPEHSSARLERFLMLASKQNIQVVVPSTPAQFFHCLRRQAMTRIRKPLIVITPKSLLRHERCVSPMEDLSNGKFRRILADPHVDPPNVRKVILCSGKVYYDLLKYQEEKHKTDIAILRVEQLYPLQEEDLRQAIALYPNQQKVVWVQEEPENMGAWWYIRARFSGNILEPGHSAHIARPSSSSPATGSHRMHETEQKRIVEEAMRS